MHQLESASQIHSAVVADGGGGGGGGGEDEGVVEVNCLEECPHWFTHER